MVMGPQPPPSNNHQNGHSLTLTPTNNICNSDTNSISHNHSHIALPSSNTSQFKGVSKISTQSQSYQAERRRQEVLQITGASTKLFNRHQYQLQNSGLSEKVEISEIPRISRKQEDYWDPFVRLSKNRSATNSNSLKFLWEAFQPELNTGYSYKCVTRSNKEYLRLLRVDINLQNSDQITESKNKKESKVRNYRTNLTKNSKKVKLLTNQNQTEVETTLKENPISRSD